LQLKHGLGEYIVTPAKAMAKLKIINPLCEI